MAVHLRGLRTFCLAAGYLSFKEAADELCLTASAVSHQIGDLETQLGMKLFNRKTRSIALTERGENLYAAISPSLRAIDEAVEAVKSEVIRVPLLVQVPEFFASEILMPILGAFSDEHRDIDLRIESMNINDKINPKADINIVLSRKRPPGNRVEKLFPIRYIPACSQSLQEEMKQKGFFGLDAINDCTILLHKARPNSWVRWAQHAGVANIKPKQIIYVDTMFALARAAEQSAGIALVPMPISRAWFESAALVPLHEVDLLTEDYYWMALGESSKNVTAAAIFWQWVVSNLQSFASSIDDLDSAVA